MSLFQQAPLFPSHPYFKFLCSSNALSFFLKIYVELIYNIVLVSSVQQYESTFVQWLSCVWPYGLQHAGLPCPSPSPGACSNSCPLSQWCHPTISSSVIPFSSCPQSFPASGSFQMSRLFASDGQSIGTSASTSVLPMNIQDWFPLGWTGLISLMPKGLSRVFSSTTVNPKWNQPWIFIGRTDVEAEAPILWPPLWCKEPSHWKGPWCWERLKAEEGGNRGWDGWMASSTQWTWVWANCGR